MYNLTAAASEDRKRLNAERLQAKKPDKTKKTFFHGLASAASRICVLADAISQECVFRKSGEVLRKLLRTEQNASGEEMVVKVIALVFV